MEDRLISALLHEVCEYNHLITLGINNPFNQGVVLGIFQALKLMVDDAVLLHNKDFTYYELVVERRGNLKSYAIELIGGKWTWKK